MNLLLGLTFSTIFCHIAFAVRFFSGLDTRSPPELVEEVVSMDSAINWAERKGRNKAQLEIARNLLKDGMSPEFVQRNTGLSLEEISELS